MPASQKPDHQVAAEKIRAKLPKATRDATEVVAGGGAYSLLKHEGRTVAAVRAANVRVTFAHDGSDDELEALSKVIAVAAKSRASAKAAKDVNPEGDSAD